jgi:alpha/beta superfamily hydrolase
LDGAHESRLALVAPPHPMYGGSMDSPVVHVLERVYQAAGFSTLAFNFRGVGASEGVASADLALARADYLAAAQALPGRSVRWVSGYSFGSCAALLAAMTLGAQHVLLVAPPLSLLDRGLLAEVSGRVLVVVGDDDEYCPVSALRPVFAGRGEVQILEGVGHFFGGEGLRMLAEALVDLIGE